MSDAVIKIKATRRLRPHTAVGPEPLGTFCQSKAAQYMHAPDRARPNGLARRPGALPAGDSAGAVITTTPCHPATEAA